VTDNSTWKPRRLARRVTNRLRRPGPPATPNEQLGHPIKLSVILPIYNSDPAHLDHLLQAIHYQSHSNWECVVVDDGSTDRRGVAAARQIAEVDQRFTLHERAQNGGIATATNDALVRATGDWVLFCDHDDLILPGAFETIAEYIAEHPGDDLIYTDEVVVDEDGGHIADYRKPDYSPERLLGHNYLCHIVTARRSLVERIGGLDSAFEPVADNDFDLRAVEAARHVGHIPEILYAWRSSPGSLASSGGAKENVSEGVLTSAEAHIRRTGLRVEVAPNEQGPTLLEVHRPASDAEITEVAIEPSTTAADVDKALRRATTKYVALKSSSANEGWHEPLVAICAQTKAALTGPKLLTENGLIVSAGRVHHPSLLDLFQGTAADNPGPWGSFCVNREVASIAAPGAVFDREAVLNLGGFDIGVLLGAVGGAISEVDVPEPLSLDLAMALLGTALRLEDRPVIWTPLVTLVVEDAYLRTAQYWAALADAQRALAATVPALIEDPFSPNGVHRA
jgi:hypothetical protein